MTWQTWHFGMAVRGWRERMSPQDSGLTLGGERRISGLRRQDLAGLAGISNSAPSPRPSDGRGPLLPVLCPLVWSDRFEHGPGSGELSGAGA